MTTPTKYRKLRIVADPEQFVFSHICDAETGEPIAGVRGISFTGHSLGEEKSFPYVTLILHAYDVEFVVANTRAPAPGNVVATIGGHTFALPITASHAALHAAEPFPPGVPHANDVRPALKEGGARDTEPTQAAVPPIACADDSARHAQ